MKQIYIKLLKDEISILSYLENDLEIDTSCCQIVNSVVNCSQSINISLIDIYELAVQFGEIKGDFICNNCRLTTLYGMPYHVEGNFICRSNYLTNLEFAPKYVGGEFDCSNNEITSLEFRPDFVGSDFKCNSNRLTSFEYSPQHINGNFYCSYNLISSFKHCPEKIERDADFSYNNFSSLEHSPKEIKGYMTLNNNPIQTLNHIPQISNGISIYALPLLSAYNTKINDFRQNLFDYQNCFLHDLQKNFDNLEFHARIFRENRSNGYYYIGYKKARLIYNSLADKCKALYTAWPWLYTEFCKYEAVLLEHFDYRTIE